MNRRPIARSIAILIPLLLPSFSQASAPESAAPESAAPESAAPESAAPESAAPESAGAAARVLSLIDVVLENHVSPPARQQLVLGGAQALYRTEISQTSAGDSRLRRWLAPKGLSARVSQMTTAEQFQSFLAGLFSQCQSEERAEVVVTNAIVGMLAGGGRIIDAENNAVEEQVRANRYVGIGIAIAMNEEEKLPQIPRVFYDGPAWKAGIKNGDLIVEIDGSSASGKDLKTIVDELRGEDGSSLTVIVRRPDSEELRIMDMTRGRVFIPTVEGRSQHENGKWVYRLDADRNLAYCRFTNIGPSTLHELRKLADHLQQEQIAGLIVDLRSAGGTLHDTVMVTDSFMDGGTIGHVQTLDGNVTHQARPGGDFGAMPLALLIGPGTSSGHSLLAAALQDSQRASLIGQVPSSAAFVRTIVPLPGREDKLVIATGLLLRSDGAPLLNGMLKSVALPTAVAHLEDMLPNKSVADRSVLRPDHEVVPTEGEPDEVLNKAIEVLQIQIRASEELGQLETVSG